jgi:hypothetical protein
MIRAAAFIAFASPAFGETISIGRTWAHGEIAQSTTITITPSDIPGEWAIVTLDNRPVNDDRDTREYTLPFDGSSVRVEYTWDADGFSGADRMTIIPPDGITCQPEDCQVTAMEGFTGRVVLIDWMGF